MPHSCSIDESFCIGFWWVWPKHKMFLLFSVFFFLFIDIVIRNLWTRWIQKKSNNTINPFCNKNSCLNSMLGNVHYVPVRIAKKLMRLWLLHWSSHWFSSLLLVDEWTHLHVELIVGTKTEQHTFDSYLTSTAQCFNAETLMAFCLWKTGTIYTCGIQYFEGKKSILEMFICMLVKTWNANSAC